MKFTITKENLDHVTKEGNFEEAQQELQSALKYNPDNEAAKVNLSTLYVNQAVLQGNAGNHQEALDQLMKALSIDPSSKTAKQNIAILEQIMGASSASSEDQAAPQVADDVQNAGEE